MKKYLALGLISTLLLTSCSVDWNDANTTFKKKQECLTYKGKIEDKLNTDASGTSNLESLFYSPKKNSCLYIYEYIGKNGSKYRILTDYLTNDNIKMVSLEEGYSNTELDTLIKELKGE